jgi:hypothetical protein
MMLDRQWLVETLGTGALAERPHLFSDTEIRIPGAELHRIAAFVQGVTELVATPDYQSMIAARHDLDRQALCGQPPGVCLGFDFHRTPNGPKLIEMNTNAGGAMLVTLLNRAWGLSAVADVAETDLIAMFRQEWTSWLQPYSHSRPLRTIAIVDETPEQQYLYPEFLRWQSIFEAHGLQALICDPATLVCDAQGLLSHQGVAIDLLYNRLTDFALNEPAIAAIRSAWQMQLAGYCSGTLITPHPAAHALWADKRNLDTLSDPVQLASLGLTSDEIDNITGCVPRTVPVRPEQHEHFWAARKGLFFKPEAGFGSRATYRGDKLTKRVFEEIMVGGYVAQDFVPPPEIATLDRETGENVLLKYDLRVYAYAGEIQLLAARLYQGQTTNFRTPGGGFAPVRLSDH